MMLLLSLLCVVRSDTAFCRLVMIVGLVGLD